MHGPRGLQGFKVYSWLAVWTLIGLGATVLVLTVLLLGAALLFALAIPAAIGWLILLWFRLRKRR